MISIESNPINLVKNVNYHYQILYIHPVFELFKNHFYKIDNLLIEMAKLLLIIDLKKYIAILDFRYNLNF